jgi:hypothetical protein
MVELNLLYYKNESRENKYKHLYKSKIILKIISCYNISELNRFWIQIYYSDDISKDNIFIIMQNPSNDEKINNTFTKIVKKFKEYNLYSLTIINLFSIIETNINKTNYNKILNDTYNNLNIYIIKEKFNELKPKKCIFGCGQHLIKHIIQCNKKSIEQYKKIIDIIKNSEYRIKVNHFGELVVNESLPKHPLKIKELNITEIDIDILTENLNKLTINYTRR